MDILEQIQITKFTQSEEMIKDYLLTHKTEIQFMSIQAFARETFTSNAAIIRFCKKIHLSGFKELKVELVKSLEREKYSVSIDYNRPFDSNDKNQEIMNHIASIMHNSIDICMNSVNMQILYRMANYLDQANHIYLYAYGDSEVRALSFKNKLFKINKHPIITTLLGEELAYSKLADKKDVALFISYTGENKDLLDCAKLLKRKTPIFLLTARLDTPLAKISDEMILIPDKESKEEAIATFYSQVCFEYILNCLYSFLYHKHYQMNDSRKKQIS